MFRARIFAFATFLGSFLGACGTSPETVTAAPLAPGLDALATAGSGLNVEYFNGLNFSGQSVKRTEARVNFDWGTGSPDPAIAPNTFSARYTGELRVPTSEHGSRGLLAVGQSLDEMMNRSSAFFAGLRPDHIGATLCSGQCDICKPEVF